MKDYAVELWHRADTALDTAHRNLQIDPDAAASRAYYASFYAVSALFALEGKTFKRHSTVEGAVHRDLVKEGLWAADLGTDYRELRRLRATGDYGGFEHVEVRDAEDMIARAHRILEAVRQAHPELDEADEREGGLLRSTRPTAYSLFLRHSIIRMFECSNV